MDIIKAIFEANQKGITVSFPGKISPNSENVYFKMIKGRLRVDKVIPFIELKFSMLPDNIICHHIRMGIAEIERAEK